MVQDTARGREQGRSHNDLPGSSARSKASQQSFRGSASHGTATRLDHSKVDHLAHHYFLKEVEHG